MGTPIFHGSIGELVITTIQIIVYDYSSGIKVIDPFPGAFDPLDDSFLIPAPDPKANYLSWFYIYGAFSQKEFLNDKVVFYGQNIYPGTYSVQYYSIIKTPGSFVVPPTTANDISQPEIMGSSDGLAFTTTSFIPFPVQDGGVCLPWEDRQIPFDKLAPYFGPISQSVNLPQPQRDYVPLIVGLTVALVLIIIGVFGGYIFLKFNYKKKPSNYNL